MVTYSFRLHFELDIPGRLRTDRTELLLSSSNDPTVRLKSVRELPFLDATEFSIVGSGYATQDHACDDGERWQSALVVGLAQHHISAALRLRQYSGGYNEAGFDAIRQAHPPGSPMQLHNHVAGVQTFPTEPPAYFSSFRARGLAPTDPDQLLASIQRAHVAGAMATPEQLLAFEMYNASFVIDASDVGLVSLMMAIEILIKQELRSAAEQVIVQEAIERAQQLSIDHAARQSFASSLKHLLHESIGSAGRRLARSLGEATYMGESPEVFFMRCYGMRSKLVHGGSDRPALQEVRERAGTLRRFVGDLLRVSILGQ